MVTDATTDLCAMVAILCQRIGGQSGVSARCLARGFKANARGFKLGVGQVGHGSVSFRRVANGLVLRCLQVAAQG
jgi:hypothetical protein